MSKALVHINDNVPLRIINLSDETEKLYRDTHIANLSFVSSVNNTKQKGWGISKSGHVPSHLYECLSHEQCTEVAKILINHKRQDHIFKVR